MPNKRLRVVAGPNGSGKTTVVEELQKLVNCGVFVNADEIDLILTHQKALNIYDKYGIHAHDKEFQEFLSGDGLSWIQAASQQNISIKIIFKDDTFLCPEGPGVYDAAMAADFIRRILLKKGLTFTFETVLSHPSKIDILKNAAKAGYMNYLYFVCTADPAINIRRVAQRVLENGHNVPEDKIINRYNETLSILPFLIPYTHRVFLFDNSSDHQEKEIKVVAEIEDGKKLTIHSENVPWWLDKYVIEPIFK